MIRIRNEDIKAESTKVGNEMFNFKPFVPHPISMGVDYRKYSAALNYRRDIRRVSMISKFILFRLNISVCSFKDTAKSLEPHRNFHTQFGHFFQITSILFHQEMQFQQCRLLSDHCKPLAKCSATKSLRATFRFRQRIQKMTII